MNIISFSLYGDNPIYTEGLRNQLPMLREFYPGWEIHVWSSGHFSHKLWRMTGVWWHEPPSCILSPPSWRLAAANLADLGPDARVIFRDADSRPSAREAAAVQAWIESDLPVHVMRDNAHHRKPILSGMWGCVPSKLPDLVPLWIEWQASHLHNPLGYGNDEDFLTERVWPIAQQLGVLQHDRYPSFEITYADGSTNAGSVPFPEGTYYFKEGGFSGLPSKMKPYTVERDPESFIGEKVWPDGTPVDPSYRSSRPEHLAPQ